MSLTDDGDGAQAVGTPGAHDKARAEPFVKTPVRLLRNGLSMGAKLAYTVLQSYAWQDGETFVGQHTIAEALNRSVRQVQRYLVELERAGQIRREQRGMPAKTYYVLDVSVVTETRLSSTVTTPVSEQGFAGETSANPHSSTVTTPMSCLVTTPMSYDEDSVLHKDSAGGAYEAPLAPLATPSVRSTPNAETARSESAGESPVYPAGVTTNGNSANGVNALPPSSLETLGVRDEEGMVRAVEIVTRLGSDAADGEFVTLVRSALAESAAGVEACLSKIEQAQAAGRVSSASGLLIKMLGDRDHRKLGQPAGERCLCGSLEGVQDYARFNGGSPLFLCAFDAGQLSPGGEPRTYAELAAAEFAPAD